MAAQPEPFNAFDSQDFRSELSKMFDEKLARFDEKFTSLEAVQTTVKEHDKIINRAYGGVKVLGLLWAALAATFVKHVLKTP